jgi:hypothetical protein
MKEKLIMVDQKNRPAAKIEKPKENNVIKGEITALIVFMVFLFITYFTWRYGK